MTIATLLRAVPVAVFRLQGLQFSREALEMLFVLLIGSPSPVVTPAHSTFPDQIYLPQSHA